MNCKIYNVGGADSTVATIGLSDESQVIAHVPYETPEDRANAEFIVRAVNSHDALLAACQSLLHFADLTGWGDLALAGSGNEQQDVISIRTMELARKAIALATGNESGKGTL